MKRALFVGFVVALIGIVCLSNAMIATICVGADQKIEHPNGVKTESGYEPDDASAWQNYYHACINVRYREIDGDDGFLKDWQELKKLLYPCWEAQDENKLDSSVLEALVLVRKVIERHEWPEVKHDVMKQSQGDVNEHFYGVRTIEEIRSLEKGGEGKK
jgi:hypothetical protein